VSLKERLANAGNNNNKRPKSRAAKGEPSRPFIEVVNMSDVQPEAVEWLWRGRFALGKVHLLAGMPGVGKGMFSCDFTARITTGKDWPDGEPMQNAGHVVMLCGEDGLADTIRPRLDAHEADASKVNVMTAVVGKDLDGTRLSSVNLANHMDLIDDHLGSHPEVRAMFIDPIDEYLAGTDTYRSSDVRSVLAPLSRIAEKRRVAVILVTHFSKGGKGPALYKSLGSVAFVAQARIAWAFCRDNQDDDRVLFLPLKNNLHKQIPGLSFRIAGGIVEWEDGEVTISADEAMAEPRGPKPDKLVEAVAWVKQALAQGCVASDTLNADAEAVGIKFATLKRAKKEVGCVVVRSERHNGQWFVSLPSEVQGEVQEF